MNKKVRGILDEDEEKRIPDHIPLNDDINSQMKIDVSVNKQAHVHVYHDQPFGEPLEWIEFDADDGSLTFITKGGRLNRFTLDMKPIMKRYLAHATKAELFLIKDGKPRDYSKVQIITRETVH